MMSMMIEMVMNSVMIAMVIIVMIMLVMMMIMLVMMMMMIIIMMMMIKTKDYGNDDDECKYDDDSDHSIVTIQR